MTVGIGSNPSFIRRSLIWSWEILEKGLLWRVGNGKSIKIFADSWVPSLISKISIPNESWPIDATVETLIKNGAWDITLIRNNFNPFIAEEIIKIPLLAQHSGDTIFWRFDMKGCYSVRDGYRLQRGLFLPPVNQTEHSMQKWWSFIWKLSLPPKVRIFWWRIAHDIIPTNQNLLYYHVPVSGKCHFCHLQPDSTSHSLFFCEVVKKLWKNSEYYPKLKIARGFCTMDLCCWLSEKLSRDAFEKLAVQTWAIWKGKLDILHGNNETLNEMNITWARAFLAEFQAARYVDRHISTGLCAVRKWKTPDKNALKLNVDACINENLNRYSVGGVLRDNQGRLLLAFGKQISKPIYVLMGELETEEIKILYDRQFHDVQVATDSLLAVQAVTNSKDDLGYAGLRASEIRNLAKEPVVSDFIHENRLTNNVAHNIAHFSSYYHSSFVWVNGEFSSWLVNLVTLDLSQ